MTALTSAFSGLRVHQAILDVIGNNLANSNTTGFRSSRVTFSDLLSQTIRPAASPTATLGGRNPLQIGLGVQLNSIDMRATAGVLNETGRPLDLAIQGNGFFELTDGTSTFYSRAGIFGLDEANFLVDSASGFRVRDTIGSDIQVAVDELMPAQATSSLRMGGNLPAEITGPLAEVLTTTKAFAEGTSASLTGTASEPFALADGDTLSITVDGGVPQTVVFDSGNITVGAATAAEVAAAITAQATGVNVDGSTGSIVVSSARTGESSSIKIDDGNGNPAVTLGLSTSLVLGTQTAATAASDLNDLADNITDYVNTDVIEVTGTDSSGQPIAGSFQYGVDGTTLGDLVAFTDALIPDASVSIDSEGNVVAVADETGESTLFVKFNDAATNTGQSQFASHSLTSTTEGTGPDTVRTSIDVFDSRGLRHTLTLTMVRSQGAEWDLTVTTDNDNDQVIDGQISKVTFNEDGSFATAAGTGVGDLGIDIVFDGLSSSQSIDIDFGSSGSLEGVTQLGDAASFRLLSQDGFSAGDLVTLNVNADGNIEGLYSNGESQSLGQIAVVTFPNAEGLLRRGNSMFEESANSGEVQRQSAGSGSAGTIVGGVLESSNVDTAEEFVRLIEAQRGFQANARVIRVSDELLAEVVNLV